MMAFVDFVTNPQLMVMLLAGGAAFATIITLGMPYLSQDTLATRMKYVASEREALRAKLRAEMEDRAGSKRGTLRSTPKGFAKKLVDSLNLRTMLESEDTQLKMKMAGFRGQGPIYTFLFFRIAMPPIVFAIAAFYVFFVLDLSQPPMAKLGMAGLAGLAGFYLPNVFLQNIITRRQQAIQQAFPDALDLLLICVEAGMSVEAAFNKVAAEIGVQSVELAEELGLTTAELSYLQDRRVAYENLGKRTGLPGVKAVTTSLIQAERYGTPLGSALRVMAQENRDIRMAAAEKKAAGLPPKLTVPMIAFFLPVLFVVILGPAVIRFTMN
ncbi:type II secretion system F family protein [Pyruvatibacter sp.]|uniref:type II secretion system F family protein n=1 Tax=Pyruvatibacter sp. TaxID=1981328 RepID=UPI0032EAB00D